MGGPREVADRLEELFSECVCDGFVVGATHVPGGYADFVDHVVPELQRRGLYHTEYTGGTLRDNLGLPRPAVGRLERQASASSAVSPYCSARARSLVQVASSTSMPLAARSCSRRCSISPGIQHARNCLRTGGVSFR